MGVTVFENQEHRYKEWLLANPGGYVLNTHRRKSPGYMSLHCASCRIISKNTRSKAEDAFTGREYIKVCSENVAELRVWIIEHGGTGFTNLCSLCNPNPDGGVGSLQQINQHFDEKVRRSQNDTAGRKQRLRNAAKKPDIQSVFVAIFKRNPDVVAEVIERANGFCERDECRRRTPFLRATDNSPYLEVHHKIPLAEGGEDTVENAVALCPNCHRELHYGRDRT